MNSLVGYGVSSESDSEGEEDVNNGAVGSVKKLCDEASSGRKTRNFMLESGSASSESEPEEDYPSSSPQPQKPAPPPACHPTLPAPSLDSITSNKFPPPSLHTCSGSSVFTNPFKAQADQKLSALQKHTRRIKKRPSQVAQDPRRRQKRKSQQASRGRRRVGLSNTLIPPKRAMKQYAIQRSKEQLHMS
ncbi:hypothetical protein KUCAC02_015006 [Chaenocephalus aceratus]|uniref:Uncharacterized protein n=1 Tax=Chaenocephalus aceratus TaxID=36190 RepID=A0ACB9XW71_CHAAC|nr:hypothetical protein KUCAC02_015006 [Chaenocephalus aceratus]